MKMRKLFKDEWGLDRDWFIFAKGILFILIFSGIAGLTVGLITAAMPQPYEGKWCYCERQEESQ